MNLLKCAIASVTASGLIVGGIYLIVQVFTLFGGLVGAFILIALALFIPLALDS